jgi:hypothetical protein
MTMWNILWRLRLFYKYLVYFVFIWYIFSGFGIMCQENLATLHRTSAYLSNNKHGTKDCWQPDVGYVRMYTRVARWYIFKPKISIWVNFVGSCNITSWSILWPFGLFYNYLVYLGSFGIFCGLFGTFFPVLVSRKIWQPWCTYVWRVPSTNLWPGTETITLGQLVSNCQFSNPIFAYIHRVNIAHLIITNLS